MKKLISTIVLSALAGVSVNAYSAQEKVLICHNYQTISVAMPAVQSHVNHGDFIIAEQPKRACEKTPGVPGTGPETDTYVVMMRCDGLEVVSLEDSSDAGIDAVPAGSCPQVLADLMNSGLRLESVTGGSATGEDEELHLYTDYLLLGDLEETEEE